MLRQMILHAQKTKGKIHFSVNFPPLYKHFFNRLLQMHGNGGEYVDNRSVDFTDIFHGIFFQFAPVTALASAFREKRRAVKLHQEFPGRIAG